MRYLTGFTTVFLLTTVSLTGAVTPAWSQSDGQLPSPLMMAAAEPSASNTPTVIAVPQPVSAAYNPSPLMIAPNSVDSSRFYAEFDTMFLQLGQVGNHDVPFIDYDTDETNPSSNSFADGRFRAVPRINFGFRFDDGSALEATYFGRNNWGKSAAAVGEDELQFMSLTTSIENVELNRIVPATESGAVSCLCGFRYLQFNEKQSLTENDPSFYEYATYSTNTTNNLFGGQIGARWQKSYQRWTLTATGKFGVFANYATQQQQYFADLDGPFSISSYSSRTRTTLLQEIGLNSRYQLTSSLALRAGYNFFWIEGLARAGGQDDIEAVFPASPVVHTNGNAFMHGPSVGAELRF